MPDKMIAQRKRVLAGRPDREFLAVVVGDIVVRFERVVLNFLKAKGVFENVIGLGEALFDVFPAEGQVVADIGAVESFRRAVDRTAQLGARHAALRAPEWRPARWPLRCW